MAQLLGEISKAVIAYTEPRISGRKRSSALDELAPVLKVFAQVQQAWLSQPNRLLKIQIKLCECRRGLGALLATIEGRTQS